MITFLHTTSTLVERFEKLVRKYHPNIPIKHYVNEDLLKNALLEGKTDTLQFNKEVDNIIEKEGNSLLVCTCSTFGQECDNRSDIYRIDEPIVSFLVSKYQKIGLAYTANSTKEVSKDLILKTGAKLNKAVEVIECDCSPFWKYFENKDISNYEKKIAEKVQLLEAQVDVMFLAQASMEGAITHLTNFKKEVFTSPEFGIKTFLENYED